MIADSILNKKFDGAKLFEVNITPEGERNSMTIYVWAKNRLDASNYLIINNILGTQHEIKET